MGLPKVGPPDWGYGLPTELRFETVRKGAEWCLDRTFSWHTTAKSGLFRLVFGLVGLWLGALRDFSDSLFPRRL
jgi:hypothetical protein